VISLYEMGLGHPPRERVRLSSRDVLVVIRQHAVGQLSALAGALQDGLVIEVDVLCLVVEVDYESLQDFGASADEASSTLSIVRRAGHAEPAVLGRRWPRSTTICSRPANAKRRPAPRSSSGRRGCRDPGRRQGRIDRPRGRAGPTSRCLSAGRARRAHPPRALLAERGHPCRSCGTGGLDLRQGLLYRVHGPQPTMVAYVPTRSERTIYANGR
jgi:hypothetical protein